MGNEGNCSQHDVAQVIRIYIEKGNVNRRNPEHLLANGESFNCSENSVSDEELDGEAEVQGHPPASSTASSI